MTMRSLTAVLWAIKKMLNKLQVVIRKFALNVSITQMTRLTPLEYISVEPRFEPPSTPFTLLILCYLVSAAVFRFGNLSFW